MISHVLRSSGSLALRPTRHMLLEDFALRIACQFGIPLYGSLNRLWTTCTSLCMFALLMVESDIVCWLARHSDVPVVAGHLASH